MSERPPRIHATALVEDGVTIGPGTSIWDNVHVRGPARIGRDCIVGEKSYVAYGVEIGDRVKINAYVYICTAVTIETGVMLSAGVTFTNDRFPRATTPDLSAPLGSDPDEKTLPTLVREGATLGARVTVGPGITIGRFAMVGMASVITRDVPDFHLVVGAPARSVGVVCRCGEPVHRGDPLEARGLVVTCEACRRGYVVDAGNVVERGSEVLSSGAEG